MNPTPPTPPAPSPNPSDTQGGNRRIITTVAGVLAAAVLGWAGWTWWVLHPSGVTAVTGPAGPGRRAFLQRINTADYSLGLWVADWPHTFPRPACVGEVRGDGAEPSRVFWSADGSVIALRRGDTFAAAYDFRDHKLVRAEAAAMAALLASRGGPGPEHMDFPPP